MKISHLGVGIGAALTLTAGALVVALPRTAPATNPAEIELGRSLFYEEMLSSDLAMSCATCHEQARAFAGGEATHVGVDGLPGRRNVMGLANVRDFKPLTWSDPRQRRLEDQALTPIQGLHPVEMGMGGQTALITERLSDDACYRRMFAAAYPRGASPITLGAITRALAAFERTLISRGSAYDRFRRGETTALSPSARRGMAIFFGAERNCASCHAGVDFTDAAKPGPATQSFHNIGLYDLDRRGAYPARDHGLREVSGRPQDEGRIRTPSLRNVALTAPYMHDGSVRTLEDAIGRHYRPAGNPLRDPRLASAAPDAAETADLAAFLNALTDLQFTTDRRFAQPTAICGKLIF